ncbi:CsiV family protein [Pseudomonas subflava]|uniref:CsiV family protein n=1 Tax=Pseudomonas subflava TaxID=2952933 RepID=UPI00207997CA|nr:CsiV family protein [Pseudomonas subflava]
MRVLRPLFLLLCLLAPQAFADGLFQVEVIVFRQGGEALSSSQPAPDDWAVGASPIAGNERGTALNDEAAKLNPGNGYEVLLHKAWAQNLAAVPSEAALSTGNEQFGHFPVEGVVSLSEQQRLIDMEADFWINRFDNDGLLSGSERVRQKTRLKLGELTYLDNGSLGLLVKVTQP